LVANDQRGVLSHGTAQLRRYVGQYRRGHLNPAPAVRLVTETPATAVVDGDGGLGHFAAQRATELAITKAKEVGTAAVLTKHHGHLGAAGTWTRLPLPAGCAAMCTSGVDRSSHRGRHQVTPSILFAGAGGPISFAVPAREEPPFVMDIACSPGYGRGELEQRMQIAPKAVIRLMNLSVVTMSLGGILAGVSQLPEVEDRTWPGANQGGLIVVFDLACFMPLDEFLTEMDDYLRSARELLPLPGHDRALLAGMLEAEREQEWEVSGIPLSPEHLAMLDELAAEAAMSPLAR
ncbi:MAG: Ldh family oxidoreductase, partial [Armatimonadetes bacterium]|nr:Ldh family oxidoreductase [Armatimonadota bacterium]